MTKLWTKLSWLVAWGPMTAMACSGAGGDDGTTKSTASTGTGASGGTTSTGGNASDGTTSGGGTGGSSAGTGGSSAGTGGGSSTGTGGSSAGAAGMAGADNLAGAAGSAGDTGDACPDAAESVILYTNDFETPNVDLVVTCGNSLDNRDINTLYGTTEFTYTQAFTVEAVVIDDPADLYTASSGIGGDYAIGMLSTHEEDRLALTFAAPDLPLLNVGFDLSSIDIDGCGGPFGTAIPVMRVSLYDTLSLPFSISSPGTLLDQADLTGVSAPDSWTFAWTYVMASLTVGAAAGDHVTLVFDLLESGYAAFDNLSVVAAPSSEVFDRDNDGVPDCPDGE